MNTASASAFMTSPMALCMAQPLGRIVSAHSLIRRPRSGLPRRIRPARQSTGY
ncbi:hypothetical protein IC235_14545 [Hymenobacter sp. BT664]|uniref:Uncharacterized protein n=1 Tax=Hymenobacter montanus TaxID=2771359 RepID=A0A927BF48_9BACT|nr:hypothetical protein [Hymenobacter montanus]MBD2769110.1 hypothetical protein [Hymenobacter montanus]